MNKGVNKINKLKDCMISIWLVVHFGHNTKMLPIAVAYLVRKIIKVASIDMDIHVVDLYNLQLLGLKVSDELIAVNEIPIWLPCAVVLIKSLPFQKVLNLAICDALLQIPQSMQDSNLTLEASI